MRYCGAEQFPVDADPQDLYTSKCIGQSIRRPPLGPIFTPVVVNAEDRLWRDDDYVIHQEDSGEVIVTIFGDVIGENF